MKAVIEQIEKEMKSAERVIKNDETNMARLESEINCYKDRLTMLQELRKLAEYELQKSSEVKNDAERNE